MTTSHLNSAAVFAGVADGYCQWAPAILRPGDIYFTRLPGTQTLPNSHHAADFAARHLASLAQRPGV